MLAHLLTATACFLGICAVCVVGEYDSQGFELLEGPRMERMQQETPVNCVGPNCVSRNSDNAVGAMWFGPRLGRRRRSDPKSEMTRKDMETISELLGTPYWHLQDFHAAQKRQETNFTPRLGRELGELPISIFDYVRGYSNRPDGRSDSADGDDVRYQNPPPQFSPRLGRDRFSSPARLEGELRDLLQRVQLQ